MKNPVAGRTRQVVAIRSAVSVWNKGVLCTAKKKGGRKRAVSPQCEVRLKMAMADFAIMRLTAQPHCKICIFFKRGAKNFRKRGKCTHKKERPEIAWFTVTMRRATGRPDVGRGRIRAADRPKNFNCNRFESHFQHLSNEDESGRLQPDLYEFNRWPCHVKDKGSSNDNAVWLCRFTKKKWSKKGHGAERIWTNDHSLQSQRSTISAIS